MSKTKVGCPKCHQIVTARRLRAKKECGRFVAGKHNCIPAQQNAHPTLGESATSQAVINAETLSTSDGVPPSAPARVA